MMIKGVANDLINFNVFMKHFMNIFGFGTNGVQGWEIKF